MMTEQEELKAWFGGGPVPDCPVSFWHRAMQRNLAGLIAAAKKAAHNLPLNPEGWSAQIALEVACVLAAGSERYLREALELIARAEARAAAEAVGKGGPDVTRN